jgi:hypothetical protein
MGGRVVGGPGTTKHDTVVSSQPAITKGTAKANPNHSIGATQSIEVQPLNFLPMPDTFEFV